MRKKRIGNFFIIVTVMLLLISSNYFPRLAFANNEGSVSFNSESTYAMTAESEINDNRTIIIGDDKNYPPYSFLDENANPTGFNIEIAKAAAEVMGLKVEIRLMDWSNVRKHLESGKIDAIAGMFYSKDRENMYSFTTKHTITTGDVFTRKDTSINDVTELRDLTVAVQTDGIIHEYLKKQNLNINFIEVETVDEALKLVSTKKCNYAAVLNIPGTYSIKKEKYLNLKSNGLLIEPNGYCIAVKKGNEDLLFTLNGGLKIIKATGKFDEIYNKWLGIYEQKSFYQTLIDNIPIVSAVISIIILLILWNFTLKIRVDARTRDLVKVNDALNESKEKLVVSNEEMETSFNQLVAIEEELRHQYEQLIDSEKALEEEKELIKITLLSVGDGVIVTDSYGNIIILNEMAEKISGWNQDEAKLVNFEDVFNIIDENTKEKSVNPATKALKNSTSLNVEGEQILVTKDCKEKLISYNVARIEDKAGHVRGVVLVFKDVTIERSNQKKIQSLSYQDQLTGVYNRRFFEEELRRLDDLAALPLTIVMADVNGLKLINDSFGHAVGDELLKKVANVMVSCCATNDVICRIGGDEFVMLLPKTDKIAATKIVNLISKLAYQEQVASLNISVSLGFETKYSMEEDIFDILKKAEDTMYKKKLFESPSMRGKAIGAIINTLHEKNKREEQHSHRVSIYCYNMGKAMNLSDDKIQELKAVGLLHDIGKVAIDDSILNKPGKLTEEEFEELKRHSEIGYRILSSVNDMSEMAEYVLAHHERWDGTGYPKGLKGNEIPLISRIITIADAYDAMTSDRSYRRAFSTVVATEELVKNAGTQFDPKLVAIFIEKVINS